VELSLEASTIEHNQLLAGAAGVSLEGGGMFTTLPVTTRDTTIAHNRPDECDGCTTAEAMTTRTRTQARIAPRGDIRSRSDALMSRLIPR